MTAGLISPAGVLPADRHATQFLSVIAIAQPTIDSRSVDSPTSDRVLAYLRPGLEGLCYEVESGKHRSEKIRRPV
jgi:hypothetical protein